MKYTGSDILVKLMELNGIRFVFGVPGGHLLKFYDSLYSSTKITPILTKHESGASFMATGYAQVSDSMSVCTGTVGPGATNLVTGVASAFMDSIPLLIITAQVGMSTLGKGGLQEATGEGRTIDHVELFNGITKYSTRVFGVEKLMDAFRNAGRQAYNGRPGPVHLDIMAQIFAEETDDGSNETDDTLKRFPIGAHHEPVSKAASLLLSSKKPAILAGAGASKAEKELLQLVEQYGIPVATTLRGKGVISEDHQLCLGCLGLYGTNVANKYLRSGVDVLLVVGASLGEFTTHAWDSRFQPSRGLIQVDLDSWEMGKNYPETIGIIGDAAYALSSLLNEMEKGDARAQFTEPTRIIELKNNWGYYDDPKMESEDKPLKPQRFMKLLREQLPRETIVFADIGNTLAWVENFFQVYLPNTFFICSSLASMGYGVAASIGGQLAAPDRQVVCICGDGDFQMQCMEVVTAVNYNIPVKWFVLNNQSLGMIRDLQNILFKSRVIASEFVNPDFVKLAESMGAAGYRITAQEEVRPIVEEAMNNGRPTVVDVLIDGEEFPSFDARAQAMSRAWGTNAPLFKKLKLLPTLLKRR